MKYCPVIKDECKGEDCVLFRKYVHEPSKDKGVCRIEDIAINIDTIRMAIEPAYCECEEESDFEDE